MRADLRFWGGVSDDSVFDLDEPRAEALRCLAPLVAVLGWVLGLLDLLTNGSSPPSELGFLTSAGLMVAAGAGWCLMRRSVALAGACLALGLTAALGLAVLENPGSSLAALFTLIVFAASASGARHGFVWATIASLVIVLAAHRAGWAIPDSTIVALVLIWSGAEETVVALVSDHGAKATTASYDVAQILADAGLLTYRTEDGRAVIDWSQTRAVHQRSCHVYVNLKGRDPLGIVEPGADYERVRTAAIDALVSYRDPKTGYRPVTLALRREDARVLGLYGDRVGDVVFAVREQFGSQHGTLLPTAAFGVGSLHGLFILAGPGIRPGIVERTVHLTDLVLTVCYLTGIPVPRQAEGGIVYQALEDTD